jgi:hypothetical protein
VILPGDFQKETWNFLNQIATEQTSEYSNIHRATPQHVNRFAFHHAIRNFKQRDLLLPRLKEKRKKISKITQRYQTSLSKP